MATLQWKIYGCSHYLINKLCFAFQRTWVTLKSLFYNEFADKYYIGDTCMEPMFWVVDHFTKILGPVCVIGVLILMSSMIAIAYIIGLPYWWRQGLIPTLIAVLIGHWILINVLFNYYMAYTTAPGYPPQGALIPEAVSICKKCIAPKPPRTHHCSVCNVCVLKMDHHCPWLNNCIGHFNHRYFFMFCVFVWIGILFLMGFGLPIAWEHFMNGIEPVNGTSIIKDHIGVQELSSQSESLSSEATITVERKRTWSEALYHGCIVYAALLCIAVFIAVGALLIWHSRLISRGETSIEGHINKKERARLQAEGKVYRNPYDYSPRRNWMIFLGIHSGRTWRHIILPSAHEPIGDGLQWHMYDSLKWENTDVKKN